MIRERARSSAREFLLAKTVLRVLERVRGRLAIIVFDLRVRIVYFVI
jgi:hypothetical protein